MRRAATATEHDHAHELNRFAVMPTTERLESDAERTGKGVTIAFLDSGFYPHPDLAQSASRILAFHDVSAPEAAMTDDVPAGWDWHGTQTSVVAAGNGFLSKGVYRGLASDASVVLVKVSDEGRITEENIVRGLEWVVENKARFGIRVVSISLGGDRDAPLDANPVNRAAEAAVETGLILVVAAGNSGCSEDHLPLPPATSPSVITVGGYSDSNRTGGPLDLYCSSYGETADGLVKPEVVAPAIWVAAPILPGTRAYDRAEALSQLAASPDYVLEGLARLATQTSYLLSPLAVELWARAELPDWLRLQSPAQIRSAAEMLLKDGRIVATHYQHVDGTSFAAPIVASIVAQMLEANPDLTPAAVKHILISTADRIAGAAAIRQGFGVVNARRAVELATRERHAEEHCFFCPPRIEGSRLVFTFHHDDAGRVALAGEFNGWEPAATEFEREPNGTWRAEIAAPPPGRYRYKLLLDGARWIEDPANGVKEPDGFGGFNSVVNLQ